MQRFTKLFLSVCMAFSFCFGSKHLVARLGAGEPPVFSQSEKEPGDKTDRPVTRGKNRPLFEYVQKQDDVYKWTLLKTTPALGCTVYSMKMISQKWLTEAEVDRPLWMHQVNIIVPTVREHKRAVLFINGGSHHGKFKPGVADKYLQDLAVTLRAVLVELKQIPNQPLVFHQDGEKRYEDNIIAYAWGEFFKTGDPKWMPRLPMVKSAVRAMDMTQEFLASEAGGNVEVNDFIVAGASKRGWTTWLVGVVDKRVKAIVPMVIDCLNMRKSMNHHFAAYGFWAPAIKDYVEQGIVNKQFHPHYEPLLKITDPITYLEELKIPKFVVNSPGDQFFLPDSSQFYFSQLRGEKHLWYVPNTDHGLENERTLINLASIFKMVLHEKPRPEYKCAYIKPGEMEITTSSKLKSIYLWTATNPDARDFRKEAIGKAYVRQEIKINDQGRYVVKVDRPEYGWTAYYVEFEFEGVEKEESLFLSSGVRVVPDTLPHLKTLKRLQYQMNHWAHRREKIDREHAAQERAAQERAAAKREQENSER